METTRCPECGRPAELVDRCVVESTDGPVEHAHVQCVLRHRFWLPVEYLTREPAGGAVVAARPSGRSPGRCVLGAGAPSPRPAA